MWPLPLLIVATGLALFCFGFSKLLDRLGLSPDERSVAQFEKARKTTREATHEQIQP